MPAKERHCKEIVNEYIRQGSPDRWGQIYLWKYAFVNLSRIDQSIIGSMGCNYKNRGMCKYIYIYEYKLKGKTINDPMNRSTVWRPVSQQIDSPMTSQIDRLREARPKRVTKMTCHRPPKHGRWENRREWERVSLKLDLDLEGKSGASIQLAAHFDPERERKDFCWRKWVYQECHCLRGFFRVLGGSRVPDRGRGSSRV